MKFIKVTSLSGRSLTLDKNSICLMTASMRDNAKTAIYEMYADFLDDQNDPDQNQPRALHIRESIEYVKESADAFYDNDRRR